MALAEDVNAAIRKGILAFDNGTKTVTFRKYSQGAYDPLTGSHARVEVVYVVTAVVSDYSNYQLSETIKATDKEIVFASDGWEPEKGDEMDIEGETFHVEQSEGDTFGAAWVVQGRR